MNTCVVFVCNKNYFYKFLNTCNELIHNGKYKGDICLVIGNDLLNDDLLKCDMIINNKIIIKHFLDITFTKEWMDINNKIQIEKRVNKTYTNILKVGIIQTNKETGRKYKSQR